MTCGLLYLDGFGFLMVLWYQHGETWDRLHGAARRQLQHNPMMKSNPAHSQTLMDCKKGCRAQKIYCSCDSNGAQQFSEAADC